MKRIAAPGLESRGRSSQQAWREKTFTASEVRRALPYVERVLTDASAAYKLVQRIRRRLGACPRGMSHVRLTEQRDEAVATLNRTIDECHAIGIAYIDIPNTRVGFRVEIEGRPASVLWRLGESADAIETAMGAEAELESAQGLAGGKGGLE